MKGIEIVKNKEGKVTVITLDASVQPELADAVQRLIRIARREQEALAQEEKAKADDKPSPAMTITRFREMIREAKQSGEISEREFFQMHPEWQKKEQLSSPN